MRRGAQPGTCAFQCQGFRPKGDNKLAGMQYWENPNTREVLCTCLTDRMEWKKRGWRGKNGRITQASGGMELCYSFNAYDSADEAMEVM